MDWQIERWTKKNRRGSMRISKYWRQLDEAAKRKAARNAKKLADYEPVDISGMPVINEDIAMSNRAAQAEAKQERKAYEDEARLEAFLEKMANA
jgi:hypothetical protein